MRRIRFTHMRSGKVYEWVGLGRDTSTHNHMIVYKSLEPAVLRVPPGEKNTEFEILPAGSLWLRSIDDFHDKFNLITSKVD
jgi:hypothetical protein